MKHRDEFGRSMATNTHIANQREPKPLAADRPKITLLILALNEAENLPHMLPRIPSIVDELLLVDGHSTDGTVAIAKTLRPDLRIVYQEGKGKGDAIRCGVKCATGDFIVTIDADGSMDPEEIPRFVEVLRNGCDFAKGSRFLPGAHTRDMPLHRVLGNKFFVWLVNVMFSSRYTDLCYGYNAFRRDAIKNVRIVSDGFEIETELNIKAMKVGLRVTEVASCEAARMYGEGNLKSFPDGLRIIKTIFRERFSRNGTKVVAEDENVLI